MEAVLKRYEALPVEDGELVGDIQAGNRNAFNRLMLKYQNKIYSMALRMLKNPEEAKDITQDVFFSVYRSISKFEGNSKLSTWLYRIVVNACINKLKSKAAQISSLTTDIDEAKQGDFIEESAPTFSKIEGPLGSLERKIVAKEIEKAIAKLPEENRVVVLLRDVEGLSYEEMERILSIPDGTLKSRLHRGRMELKKRLSKIL